MKTPVDVAVEVIRALQAAGFECAVGGALAYGVWAVPRGTKDVDLNVFAPEERWPALLDALVAARRSSRGRAVFKLLFSRGKDLEDPVARQGQALDAAWVRHQLVDMVGEDDERVTAWDRIVAEHRA